MDFVSGHKQINYNKFGEKSDVDLAVVFVRHISSHFKINIR